MTVELNDTDEAGYTRNPSFYFCYVITLIHVGLQTCPEPSGKCDSTEPRRNYITNVKFVYKEITENNTYSISLQEKVDYLLDIALAAARSAAWA